MKKPDWKPQNPWFYGAFPVCRNYTVRAQLRQPALRKWRQLEGNPGMAGAQWYWNDFQHLHPSGLQQQGFFCECDPGVLPGEHGSTDHWAIEKPWTVKFRAENSGAGGGTRTHTDFSTRFWVAVVCQFRHTGIYILISLVSRTSQILEGCAGGILKSNEIMKLWKRRFIKGFARALNILRSRFWVRLVCQFQHTGIAFIVYYIRWGKSSRRPQNLASSV